MEIKGINNIQFKNLIGETVENGNKPLVSKDQLESKDSFESTQQKGIDKKKAYILGGVGVVTIALITTLSLLRPKKNLLTVKKFKDKGGYFDKGKAFLKSGKEYVGKLTHNTKDGNCILLEYENGLVKKSSKQNGNDIVWQKIYQYNESGGLEKIINEQDKVIFQKFVTDKGTFIDRAGNKLFINNDGKLKYQMKEGIGGQWVYKCFYPDGKTVHISIKNKSATIYDNQGNVIVEKAKFEDFYDNRRKTTALCKYTVEYPDGKRLFYTFDSRRLFFEHPGSSVNSRRHKNFIVGYPGKGHITYNMESLLEYDDNGKFIRQLCKLGFLDSKGGSVLCDVDSNVKSFRLRSRSGNEIALLDSNSNNMQLLKDSYTEKEVNEILKSLKGDFSAIKKEHKDALKIYQELQKVAKDMSDLYFPNVHIDKDGYYRDIVMDLLHCKSNF